METSPDVSIPELEWQRSSRCGGGNCVEVAFVSGHVAVRDSKDPDRGVLLYSHDEWRNFISEVKTGRDHPAR
ncbi:DUF397 domain-containing protein [Microbispora rosea]|uniref:DUF397 domain-containing protein n=1 Tax=Microbispora rosea TaxID=58117 RepID=UPI0033D8B32D